jgi:hypothetical protein
MFTMRDLTEIQSTSDLESATPGPLAFCYTQLAHIKPSEEEENGTHEINLQ